MLAREDNPSDVEATHCIAELSAALDSYIPEPTRTIDKPFRIDRERLLDQGPRHNGDRRRGGSLALPHR
jgi:translation elongation factor EF-Tu-like GTPase